RHRHVLAEAEGVELVDPGVIARLGRAALAHVLELRAGERIERPAFRAMLAGGGRAVEGGLAFAAIEARHVAARQRHPGDTVAIDVHTARAVARQRRLVDLRQRGRRRVRARAHPYDVAGEGEHRAPHRTVVGIDADAVERGGDALVLARIDRLVRLDIVLV